MAKIEQRIEELITKPIEEAGYQLYDVYYIKEGKDYFLRVFITKPEGSIDLNDCEKVTQLINPILDEKDGIKEQYFLEVSSTGIERVLRKEKHLQNAIGEIVQASLFKPVLQKKEYVGKLVEVQDNTISLEVEQEKIILERTNVALLKIYYEWDNS